MNLKRVLMLIFFVGIIYKDYAQSITFSYGPSLSVPRTTHEMQPLPDGKLLIMGGNNGNVQNFIYHNSCEIYNPVTNAIESASSMKVRRASFMSEVLTDGNIIAIGGDNAQQYARLSCEIYNVVTKQWSYTDSLKTPHWDGEAIKLNDGRVLVAGGTVANSEVFDSKTQKWSLVGSMNTAHGKGMSLTVLKNGNVLAIGGEYAPNAMEIFSPLTNSWTSLSWTTYYKRYGHGAVLMPNGKVFIAGSGSTASDDQRYSEMFDPATNSIAKNGILQVNTFYNELIVLDNGKVLTFGLGDIFNPSSTKMFQEYTPSSQLWTASGTYNTLGATDYTIKRLSDGKIFIAGGNFTTGNGSSTITYVISQTGYTACIEPDLTSQVTSVSAGCYGTDGKIKLSTTNTATYTVYSGQNNIGSFVAAGESNLEYTIPAKYLNQGANVISLQVTKTGCIAKKIIDTATIYRNVSSAIATTVSILSGNPLLCNSSSVTTVKVDNPIAGTYQWYNGTTGNQIDVSESAFVTARYVDANGCLSLPSEPVQIRKIIYADFVSQQSLSVCNTDLPIQLTASPSGGTWSGVGVSASGLFTPANATPGNITLTYSLCGYSVNKSITVSSKSLITYNAANISWPNVDTLCGGATYIIQPNGLNTYYKTLFYVNNVLQQTSVEGYALSIYYTPDTETQAVCTFKITNFYSGSCPNDTLVISKTYKVAAKPSAVVTTALIPDTWCNDTNVKISIVHPQIGVGYYATYYPETVENKGIKIKTTQTVDTLVIYAGGGPSHITVYATPNMGCTNKVYLAQKDIVVWKKNNELTLGNVYYVGESVQPVLVSNMDSFKWTIDANNFTTKNPPAKVYNSIGTHSYKVISISGYGCIDTIQKDISILNKPPKVSENVCLFDTSRILNTTNILRSIIDKKGNTIYVGTKYVDYAGNNTGSDNGFIEKHSKNEGAPIWVLNHNPFDSYEKDFFAFIISAVTVDENNDLYITGNYSSKKLKFLGAQFDNPESQFAYSHVFVAKISEAGSLLWMMASQYPQSNALTYAESGGTDIECMNGKIYVSARIKSQSIWKSHTGADITVQNPENVKEHSIFEIDAQGTSIKAVAYMNSNVAEVYNGKANMLGFYILGDQSAYHNAKIAILAPVMKPLPGNKLLVHGRLKEYMDFGTTTLTIPIIDGKKTISEFSIILNLNTNTWESAKLEASMTGNDGELFGLVDFMKLNAVYNTQLDKFSALNFGSEHSQSSVEKQLFINSTESVTYQGEAVLLKRIDKSGNLIWKQLIKGANAEQIFISSDEKQIVVVGEYKFGINFLYKNQSYGLTHTTTKDLYAMGFNSEDGNLSWAEKIGTKDFDDTYMNAVLTDCNDLLILGYRRASYLSDKLGAVGHESDSLRYISDYPYIIRIPLTGICNNTNCGLTNPPTPPTTGLFSGTVTNESQVLLYPNPTNSQITIRSQSGKKCQFAKITDLQGQLVKEKGLDGSKEVTIDISDLPAGMYLVEVIIDEQQSVQKMYIVR